MAKIILSKHALERAKLRNIELSVIEQIILNPEQKINLKDGKFKFIKNFNNRRYQVVAADIKKENKWLVISVWVRGEDDKAPFIWVLITAPFRLLWWLLKKLFQAFRVIIAKIAEKK
jgi:hypothetical protein